MRKQFIAFLKEQALSITETQSKCTDPEAAGELEFIKDTLLAKAEELAV